MAGRRGCRWPPASRFFVLRGLNAGERNWEFEPSPYPTGGKIKRLGKSLKGCHSIHWSLSRSWRVFPSWVFQEVQPFALFPTTNIAAPDGLARRTSSSRTFFNVGFGHVITSTYFSNSNLVSIKKVKIPLLGKQSFPLLSIMIHLHSDCSTKPRASILMVIFTLFRGGVSGIST